MAGDAGLKIGMMARFARMPPVRNLKSASERAVIRCRSASETENDVHNEVLGLRHCDAGRSQVETAQAASGPTGVYLGMPGNGSHLTGPGSLRPTALGAPPAA